MRSESAALQAEALQMRSDAAAAEQAFRVVGGGLESTVQRLTEEQAQAQARTQAQLRALELQLAALSERHAATQARLAALTDGGGGGGGGGTAAAPAGLSAREIAAALPAMPFSEARNFLVDGVSRTECTICLGDFADDDEVRALPCVHIFHSACIDRWLARATCCPTCKGGAT